MEEEPDKNLSTNEESKDLVDKENESSFNYSHEDGQDSLIQQKLSNGLKRASKNKGILIGGGVAGTMLALIFFGMMSLIPLKIEDIVKNLENHFFGSSNNAVSSETDTLVGDFYTRYVSKAMGKKLCDKSADGSAIVSKDCIFSIGGSSSNPILNLYRTWSQAKLEDMLASKGIELRYDLNTKKYYIKSPDIPNGEADVTEETANGVSEGTISEAKWTEADVGNARAYMHSVEEDMTLWQKVLYRYKIGRLLETKYGIKRCLLLCGPKDLFTKAKNSLSDAKYAAKLFLVDRVITPQSEALGTIFGCLLNGNCTGKNTGSETCLENSCDELAGETESNAEVEVDNGLKAVISRFGSETADKLVSQIGDYKEKGAVKYLLEKILGKELPELDVPGLGEVQAVSFLATVLHSISNAPKTIRRLTYIADAAAAVSLYMEYTTIVSEMHTGNVDAASIGSFITSLSSGNQCPPSSLMGACDPSQQLGGTASAEQTPLYSNLMEGTNNPQPSQTYTCNNGQPVPSGQLVCPEEQLGQSNSAINDISSAVNDSGLGPVAGDINTFFNDTGVNSLLNLSGYAFTEALDLLKIIPGIGSAINDLEHLASNLIGKLFKFLLNELVPNPFGPDMSGGRTFDEIAAGADVAGNNYAHTGLGGQMLNPQQVATIQNNQNQIAIEQFQQMPLFARIFSTSTPYSLISKIAIAMPFSIQSFVNDAFVNYLQDPFKTIVSDFGTIISSKVNAQAAAQPDPFGVVQYGYTQQDLDALNNYPGGPSAYWDANCTNNPQTAYQKNNTWNSSATDIGASQGDLSESYVNTTTNPCLLIMSTVGSAGGLYNTNLLTPADLADTNIAPGTSTSSSYQNPFRNITNLTPNRIDQGVDYDGTGPIYAIGDGTVNGIYPNWYKNEPLIAYTLTDGPAQGKTIYVAECITPTPGLTAGQSVTSNTVIAQMTNCGNGIETGWADSANLPDSMAKSCWDNISSSYGVNFSQFLQSLGAPGGIMKESNPPCTLPSGWPTSW